jgi:hypothetical protein
MSICSKCHTSKDEEQDFAFRDEARGIRHKQCRDCQADYRREHYLRNIEKYISKANKWNKAHPSYKIANRYGMTGAEYLFLFSQQNGICKICGKKDDKPLHVDHDHLTGKVRGLLCRSCNLGIGHFKDDPSLLKNASEYLLGD